jgi:outer membrane protein TolC
MTGHSSKKTIFFTKLITDHLIIYVLPMCILLPAQANALQPLADLLRHAEQQNFDNREARATAVQREHEASQAWARLLPTVTAQADYIRNQYLDEAIIPTGAPAVGGTLPTRDVIITPVDQRDASFTAALTLIDIAAWHNIAAAGANREAQKARVAATMLEVQKTVAQTYYQIIGASAVGRAARRTLTAAQDNARFIETRVNAGLASELDLKRALAEVERDRQAIQDADYTTITLQRSLETLTGLVPQGNPSNDSMALPMDDLRDEQPLGEWITGVDSLPSVRAASSDRRAAKLTAAASQSALFPTVSAQATERATDATGFGQSPYYAIEFLASWKLLDVSSFQASRAQRAVAEASSVRYDRARETAGQTIFDDWHHVRTQIEKSRAARSSLDASQLALSVAREKYSSGKATLLDVVQAERDAFAAEVTQIQAEADLASARASLRLSAGHSLEAK